MNKNSKFIISIIFILTIFQLSLLNEVSKAETHKTLTKSITLNYTDNKNNFEISYPRDWIKKNNYASYNVSFSNKDETAFVGVIIKVSENKISANEYLKAIMSEAKVKKVEVKTMSLRDIKNSNADEGVYESHQEEENGTKAIISTAVFSKDNYTYVMTVIADASLMTDKKVVKLIDTIMNSFKIKK